MSKDVDSLRSSQDLQSRPRVTEPLDDHDVQLLHDVFDMSTLLAEDFLRLNYCI